MNNEPSLSDRYPDLLHDQDDPSLATLVRDLDALYTTNRIPARLVEPQASEPARLPSSRPAPLSPAGTFSHIPKPARRWSRLNSLAAVLFTVILVAALAGTFYALQHTGPAHKPSTPALNNSPTPGVTPKSGTTPAPGVVSGPRACPAAVAAPAHWEPIVNSYAYGSPHHVESVSCANIIGNSSLQALVTVRHVDMGHTLDAFVFNNITNAHPVKISQVMGLVQGDAKISNYNTVMTAQADELSSVNTGKAVSAMTADLFREFEWSGGVAGLTQTVFRGMFPDLTRYQAEDDQAQVNQGHQAWKLSATQVAITMTANLLNWSPNATATLISGGGIHDVNAVVRVKSSGQVAGTITATLSRLEGNTSGGIWEVTAVNTAGLSITSPAPLSQIKSPTPVKGTGSAFEGVIGNIMVLDHLYHLIGQAQATGTPGMGPAIFSNTVTYQSSFPAGAQEGILVLSSTSNATGSIAAAVMEKVLIMKLPGAV